MSRSLTGDQFSYRRLTDKPLVDKHAAATDALQQQKTVVDDKLATGQYTGQYSGQYTGQSVDWSVSC